MKRFNSNEYMKNRYHTDRNFANKMRETSRINNKRKLKEYREALYDILGGQKCNCKRDDCWHLSSCNVKDIRILHFDHINGKGHIDRKIKGSGLSYIKYYYDHPDEAKETLQILCANCNWIKKLQEENIGRPRL